MSLVALAALVLACSSDGGEPELVRTLAPIDSAEVVIAESFPPQYFVHIVSGLPNGCVTFDAVETARDGSTVRVRVWNLSPAPGERAVCTMLYGFVEHNVPLGSAFTPGATYTVEVNDVATMFVAQ